MQPEAVRNTASLGVELSQQLRVPRFPGEIVSFERIRLDVEQLELGVRGHDELEAADDHRGEIIETLSGHALGITRFV